MLCVIQRVSSASVDVDGQTVGRIARGLLVLVGIHKDDTPADLAWMASRLTGLRIFPDDAGKMNLSVAQVQGGILLIPNFTLCAQTGKGHRPSFIDAKAPDLASPMFDALAHAIAGATDPQTGAPLSIPCERGIFGADMKVTLTNDGPITIIIDSAKRNATTP